MTPQERAALAEERKDKRRVLREAIQKNPRIADDMRVQFEGETVRWGDLTLADRKAYFAGGYPY